jgi:DNA-binding CsgD family transcriptional regulator
MALSIWEAEKGWLEARQLMDGRNLDRLFAMMRAWWEGRTLREIAREHGISRQRVGKILASVACTRDVLRKARRDLPTSWRRSHQMQIDEAVRALLHPMSGKLTARQRAALAWKAQGLVLVDVAHRMATTVHGVHAMTYGAKQRLAKLDYKAQRQREAIDAPRFDCRDLEEILAAAGATIDEKDLLH